LISLIESQIKSAYIRKDEMSKQIQNIRFHITQYLKKEYWQNENIKSVNFDDNLEFQIQVFEALKPLGLIKFASIIHDKDLQLDNITPKPRHIHAVVEFEKKKDINVVALTLGLEPQYLDTAKRGRYAEENLLAYLIHAKDKTKYQYQPSEVSTFGTFNYEAYEEEHRKNWKNQSIIAKGKKKDEELPLLLEAVRYGSLNREQLLENHEYLYLYQRHLLEFQAAFDGYLLRAEAETKKAIKTGHLKLTTLYIYGLSNAGKSKFAEILSEMIKLKIPACKNWSSYITASTNPFDEYTGEQIVILDDLRAKSMTPENWLKILDPERIAKSSARYHNKTISAHLIIITAPLPPQTFFRQVSEFEELNQFMRRLSLTVEISQVRKERFYNINTIERKHKNGIPCFVEKKLYEKESLNKAVGTCIAKFLNNDKTINKKPSDLQAATSPDGSEK